MSKSILLIRFSSLGDIILTSAAATNLKVSFPEAELVFLTKETYRPLVESFGCVDRVVTVPEKVSPREYYRLLLKLDRDSFAAVVDLHGNPRSWLARKLVSGERAVVYPKRRMERYLTVRKNKRIPLVWPHTIDLYNQAVIDIGGSAPCRRPILRGLHAPSDSSGLPLRPNGPMVVIAPGAAHPNKQWPMERFAEVALRLHRTHDARIVWAVPGADANKSGLESEIPNDAFVELVDRPVVDLAGIMAESRVTVSNDSGLAHLSSAAGTPVVAVFGPTHRALGFAPRGLFDRVIEVEESCRPCSRHGAKACFRDRRYCFERVTADMVYEAASEIIDSPARTRRALLLDRDGTVIVEKDYLHDPDEVELEPGVVEALKKAREMGLAIVIVSNQSGIARGIFTLEDVEKVNARMLELLAAEGVEVDAVYYCPHHPHGSVSEFSIPCTCRKPAADMAEEAARELGVDLRKSFMVGDMVRDVDLGRVVGARSFLVRTGYGRGEEQHFRDWCINGEGSVCENLLDAVEHIRKFECHD